MAQKDTDRGNIADGRFAIHLDEGGGYNKMHVYLKDDVSGLTVRRSGPANKIDRLLEEFILDVKHHIVDETL